MSSPRATMILGLDGMGPNATEADFDRWVTFVCDHIDERCGFEVDVETRGTRDVQTDSIRADDEDRETIYRVKQDLWNEWCAS